MPRLRTFLTKTFPSASTLYKRARSHVHRLRHGNGDIHVFEKIVAENYWGDAESLSGSGSNLQQTEKLRAELPLLLSRLGVQSLLDAPCGDFNWMRLVDIGKVSYIGTDIVVPLIERCQQLYGNPVRQFLVRNILSDPLPRVDLILSRDCLGHFSYEHVTAALRNFRSSGASFLLTTTYTSRNGNWDIVTGSWRPLNLQEKPFNFPQPAELIIENSTEFHGEFADKCLALWPFDSVRIP
jgi:hypothetical protein